MGNWGISKNAPENEKIKSEMTDFLNGLNSVGKIDYDVYSELYDFSMNLFDKMYELGKQEGSKTVNINHVNTFDNRKTNK